MLSTRVILLIGAIFAYCESSAIVKKVNKKCGAKDDECQRDLYRSFIQDISDHGVPDLGIPRLDPFPIKNMHILVLGMLKFTLTEGEAKGFKNCYGTLYNHDTETSRTAIGLVCDVLTIEGDYKIESSPALLALLGGINVHGDGKASLVLEKLQMNFDLAFKVWKHDDGEIYIGISPENSNYTFEVLGKVTLAADNIFIGKQDISTVAVNIFNENWEFITKTFGKSVLDKAMEVFFLHMKNFLDAIPAKELIKDDLSSYLSSE